MTKKDYVAIAQVLKATLNEPASASMGLAIKVTISSVAEQLACVMAADNAKFQRQRFLDACGLR